MRRCLIITLYKETGQLQGKSGQEWIYSLFAGHGTGGFRVFAFFEMMITIGAPLYLLAVFVEKTVSGQSLFISVRTKSRRTLMRGILSTGIIFLAAYMLLWFTAGLSGTLFVREGTGKPVWKMLLYAVFLRFLDIMVQYFIMMCIYVFSKQITIGFLALTAGNLLCILPQPWVSYLPFGLSSLTRIAELNSGIGISAAAALGVETAFAVLLLVWLLIFGSRKILD